MLWFDEAAVIAPAAPRRGRCRRSERHKSPVRERDRGTLRRAIFDEAMRRHQQRNCEDRRHRRVRDLKCCTHVLTLSGAFQTENRKSGSSFQNSGETGNCDGGRAGAPQASIGSLHRG